MRPALRTFLALILAVFFSHGPARGDEVVIVQRPAWATDPVKERIVSETPGLAEALEKANHPATVRLLRRFVARQPVASCAECLPKEHILDMPLEEILSGFEKKLFGCDCYVYSVVLSKIYSRFGYESIMVSWGLPAPYDVLTHAFVVVQIESDGKVVCVAEDPLGDFEYALEGKSPTDFRDLVAALKRDPRTTVVYSDHPPMTERPELTVSKCRSGRRLKRIRPSRATDLDKWVAETLDKTGAADLVRTKADCENIKAYHMLLFPSNCTSPATKPLAECAAAFLSQ